MYLRNEGHELLLNKHFVNKAIHNKVLKRRIEFLTNLFEMRADLIAAIYKLRWQIELLFKQLKHNFPLIYFHGYNENAKKAMGFFKSG